MFFQQPSVFQVSSAENVLFGVCRIKKLKHGEWTELVERALREAFLWGELGDRLKEPARNVSVGQQPRLCLART